MTLVLLPACVVRLTDRNSPEVNGGVTGPAADCSTVTPEPKGAPGGEAAPKLVGRFAFPPDTPTEPVFDWSGNYITARFQGTDRITVKLFVPPLPETGVVQDQMFTFAVDNLPPS
ncbi:MAG TPA: hypothetical protein VM925_21540, partial [Labilithrix sp.]|nr:hypothetical protein [Labilithrix sp.]